MEKGLLQVGDGMGWDGGERAGRRGWEGKEVEEEEGECGEWRKKAKYPIKYPMSECRIELSGVRKREV